MQNIDYFINFIVNIVGKNIINSMGHNTGPSENQFFNKKNCIQIL